MTTQILDRTKLQITFADVQRAWDNSIIAADLYEIASMRRYPRHVIEARREDMIEATDLAEKMQNMYWEQIGVC